MTTRPEVDLCLSDGTLATLRPGDLIGRLETAALRISNPRISEAHALVSLRGDRLALVALRGLIRVGVTSVVSVTLEPGQRIELCAGLEATVCSVRLPDRSLAIRLGDEPPTVLASSVYSLFLEPPRLAPVFDPKADAHVWSIGDAWVLALLDGVPEPFEAGAAWVLRGQNVEAVEVPTRQASVEPTNLTGRTHPPLRIVARYDAVHIQSPGRDSVVLAGVMARIVSELVAIGGPAPWNVVAAEVWREEAQDHVLRNRWDRTLATMRARLRELGVRTDLIRADGTGRVELFLQPGDEAVDEV